MHSLYCRSRSRPLSLPLSLSLSLLICLPVDAELIPDHPTMRRVSDGPLNTHKFLTPTPIGLTLRRHPTMEGDEHVHVSIYIECTCGTGSVGSLRQLIRWEIKNVKRKSCHCHGHSHCGLTWKFMGPTTAQRGLG